MSNRAKTHNLIINEAFNLFRFNGSVFFRSSLASPWGIQLSAEPAIRFHIALKGGLSVGINDNYLIQINDGEIAIVASNQKHWIADHPKSELIDQTTAYEACKLNSPLFQHGTISHHVICCMISLEPGLTHPLLEKIPDLLPIKNLKGSDEIWSIVNMIEHSLDGRESLQNPISDRLVEILFIHLMRRAIDSSEGENIIDALISDRRIFQALNIIHKNPQFDWTVSQLGEQVGMSKSTLNRQFLLSVGETPMAYLIKLRLSKAKSLIISSNISFNEIAVMTGYSSSRSLNKAFVKHYGKNLKQQRNIMT